MNHKQKEEKIKDLKKDFDLSYDELKHIKSNKNFVCFAGVICFSCSTKYNLPISRGIKTWVCPVCGFKNDFDFRNKHDPFQNPDLGISKKDADSKVFNKQDDDIDQDPWRMFPTY